MQSFFACFPRRLGAKKSFETTKKDRIKAATESLGIQLDRQDWFELLRSVRGKEVD